ncbi:MAG TPA: hypothetical protein VMN35_08670 [Gaiellaceae bacterium]|nr:hypothetical protein [Gaiellaceae bacterium]
MTYVEAVETIATLRDAPDRLRRWAVLFEAGVFDIQGIGDGETAEPLLDLLRRVSFGEIPTTGEVEALRASTDEP